MLFFVSFVLLVFLVGLVSHRLEKTLFSAPMIFTLAGMLLFFLAPTIAEGESRAQEVLLIGEIALALVLFTDATRINARQVIQDNNLLLRLLLIGMPLTILSGLILGAVLLTGLSVWEAAILAVILAPTDAGLGQVIVHSRLAPARVRQALNAESGLNDGLSMPFFMLFIALAGVEGSLGDHGWIAYTLKQVGGGVLIGLAIGGLGGWLMGKATRRNWMAMPFQQLGLLALALLSWGLAEPLGGNGFIAAFIGGLAVKLNFEQASERAVEFSEAWGQLLNFFVFFFFGIVAASRLPAINIRVVLYALLSLTVVRILPVAIALLGTRLKRASVLFIGWFGPRGLASIVLGLVFLEEEAELLGQGIIMLTVIVTVLFSILLHGISANPGIELYARQVKNLPPEAPEFEPIPSARSPEPGP